MATKLIGLRLTSVDLVRVGANQEADICLYKSFDGAPQEEPQTSLQEEPRIISKSDPDRFDTICEVEKFNPFHDARGRFSNKHGFSTYSANPKMKVAQPSIARSAQAGHGHTMNVHRESKGENINQNYDWMQGKKPAAPAAPPTKPTTPAKPAKPAQPKQNPQQDDDPEAKQKLSDSVDDVQLTSSQKLAIQPRDAQGHTTTDVQKVAYEHFQDRVDGKDISGTADIRTVKNSTKNPIDKMAELQDWNHGSTVTDDLELFQKAAVKSGVTLIRTVHPNGHTGQSSADVCKETMSDGNANMNGTGMQAYGGGIYMVGAVHSTRGKLSHNVATSQMESSWYGDTQMMATVHSSAKIATPSQASRMKGEFYRLSRNDQARFGDDFGAYIASKGYDGAQWHSSDSTSDTPYITIYNKSALIYYSGAADVS